MTEEKWGATAAVRQTFQSLGLKVRLFIRETKDSITKGIGPIQRKTRKLIHHRSDVLVDLVELCQEEQQNIPLFIQKCAKIIHDHRAQEGLFRVCPDYKVMCQHKEHLQKHHTVDMIEQLDIHTVCQLFKHFYSIISPRLLDDVIDRLRQCNGNFAKLSEAVGRLQRHYCYNVVYLALFLNKMAAAGSPPSTDAKYLAILISPVLISNFQQSDTDAIQFLIQYANELSQALSIAPIELAAL